MRRMWPSVGAGVRAVCAAAVVVATACGGETPPTEAQDGQAALTADRFVDIVSAVRRAEWETTAEDSPAVPFQERRQEILESNDVTEEDLRAFLRAHADDTDLLRTVWSDINERLKHATDPEGNMKEGPPGFRPR